MKSHLSLYLASTYSTIILKASTKHWLTCTRSDVFLAASFLGCFPISMADVLFLWYYIHHSGHTSYLCYRSHFLPARLDFFTFFTGQTAYWHQRGRLIHSCFYCCWLISSSLYSRKIKYYYRWHLASWGLYSFNHQLSHWGNERMEKLIRRRFTWFDWLDIYS